jgi:hypothetical protein
MTTYCKASMTKIIQQKIYLFFWDELTKQSQYKTLESWFQQETKTTTSTKQSQIALPDSCIIIYQIALLSLVCLEHKPTYV